MRVGVQKKERKSEERASLSVGGLVDWPSRNDETKNTRAWPHLRRRRHRRRPLFCRKRSVV